MRSGRFTAETFGLAMQRGRPDLVVGRQAARCRLNRGRIRFIAGLSVRRQQQGSNTVDMGLGFLQTFFVYLFRSGTLFFIRHVFLKILALLEHPYGGPQRLLDFFRLIVQ